MLVACENFEHRIAYIPQLVSWTVHNHSKLVGGCCLYVYVTHEIALLLSKRLCNSYYIDSQMFFATQVFFRIEIIIEEFICHARIQFFDDWLERKD